MGLLWWSFCVSQYQNRLIYIKRLIYSRVNFLGYDFQFCLNDLFESSLERVHLQLIILFRKLLFLYENENYFLFIASTQYIFSTKRLFSRIKIRHHMDVSSLSHIYLILFNQLLSGLAISLALLYAMSNVKQVCP